MATCNAKAREKRQALAASEKRSALSANFIPWRAQRSKVSIAESRPQTPAPFQCTYSFCLPICINNGALFSSYVLEIPAPGFRVDGFTNTTKNLKRAQIVFLRRGITVTHQKTNSSGCSVKLSNLVTLHHIPVAALVWINRRRLEQKGCGAIQKGTINNIRVAAAINAK